MRFRTLCFLFVIVGLLGSVPLKAESKKKIPKAPPAPSTAGSDADFVIEKRGGETIKYKKKTTYDFDGASIDGVYNKPSGSYISNIKDVKAKSI